MEKLAINTKVEVHLKSGEIKALGLSASPENPCVITGYYSLGYYLKTANGRTIAITDKYDALKLINP